MRPLTDSETKDILLNILVEIDAFCSKNNLKYYLAYGTLLGAVRHNGFIPWDDDIDICMPRPDYEKFISTFKSKNPRYEVLSHLKDNKYPYYFAKVHDRNTLLETKLTYKNRMGLYVDIFPIDAVPSDINLQKRYMRKFNFYRNIYNIRSIRLNRRRSPFKNALILMSRLVTSVIPFIYLQDKIDRISKLYNYEDHNLVSIAAVTDQRLVLDKKLFSEGIKMKFENIEVKVPVAYEIILSKNYGNYMKLPPVEKQVSHHEIKAFVING
jgi:lipopolysaccharide cholinephosphotransferase